MIRLRTQLATYAALFAVLALMATMASHAEARGGLVDQARLRGTSKVQKWESTPLGGRVFVGVYVHGVALEQSGYRTCGATYRGEGLIVWLRLLDCTKPGRHPALVRYLSFAGERSFTVRITRHDPGPSF
jgi:hypothetical protein